MHRENVRSKRDLHVFRMMTDAVDQLVWLQFTNANLMDACEQRKPTRKQKKDKFWQSSGNDFDL